MLEDEDAEEERSPGWWITPTGEVFEIEEIGHHGVEANGWLSDHVEGYAETGYDQSILHMQKRGGVRLSTFHGSANLNIDFLPACLSSAAHKALLRFLQEHRHDFVLFFFGGDEAFRPCSHREACDRVRQIDVTA